MSDATFVDTFVETDELSIHMMRDGAGTPVILLHGWPEFVGTWKHNFPVLAEHFDVIAPELRGFGQTRTKGERRQGGSPPQLLARDLRDFADALGLERFAIVSHDVGAVVAQTFALAHPDRVSALFFFNCPYPGIGERWGDAELFPETWYQQFHQQSFAADLIGSSREACRIYVRAMLSHWAHDPTTFDEDLEAWVDNMMRPGNLQGGFDWYVGISGFRRRMMRDGAPPMPKISAPTQFLWGAHDPVLRVEWIDRLDDYFANYQVKRAEEAGHFVHYEMPELANAEMIRFLSSVSV